MSDTNGNHLRAYRDALGLSREMVVRSPGLEPPISVKTLERWESGARVKEWRLRQLAGIYKCKVAELR